MSKEAMKLALGKIKSARDCHPNAVNTLLFEAEEILEEALAKPDFWEGYVPEPVKPAQHEPDWLDKEQTETDWDHVWLLIKAANYASSKGFISGTTNWGSAVSRYMRNESPQPAQRTWVGLTDDEIFSVLGNLQRKYNGPPTEDSRVVFALAIEAKLKEKNT